MDEREQDMLDQGVRLQKILAQAGVGSRRRCEELISDGRVMVNGVVVRELGSRAKPGVDRIEVDGVDIGAGERIVHYAVYKPVGYVSTVSDPEGRPQVTDLVPTKLRVYPVGRLDYDSEGLIIITNDGHLTEVLTHPSHEIGKTYLALVSGKPDELAIGKLRHGVDLEDGVTAPARVRLIKPEGDDVWIELTIHEGRNRQVRRMCEAVGHPVIRLIRTRIGHLNLAGLQPGKCRALSADDVAKLEEQAAASVGEEQSEPAAARKKERSVRGRETSGRPDRMAADNGSRRPRRAAGVAGPRRSEKSGGSEGPRRAAKAGGYEGPRRSTKAAGYDGPRRSAKAAGYDGPRRSAKTAGYEGPRRSTKASGYEGPRRSTKADGYEGPRRSEKSGGSEGPRRAAKAGGYEGPRRSTKAAGYEGPRRSTKADGYEGPRRSEKSGGSEGPRRAAKAAGYEGPRRSVKAGGHEGPGRPVKAGGYEKPRRAARGEGDASASRSGRSVRATRPVRHAGAPAERGARPAGSRARGPVPAGRRAGGGRSDSGKGGGRDRGH